MEIPDNVYNDLADLFVLQIRKGRVDVELRRRLPHSMRGVYIPSLELVHILSTQPMDEKIITLLHELLHRVYGIDEADEDQIEDAAVLMASTLTVAQRNFFENFFDSEAERQKSRKKSG